MKRFLLVNSDIIIVKLWFYEDIKKETSRNGFGEGSKAS